MLNKRWLILFLSFYLLAFCWLAFYSLNRIHSLDTDMAAVNRIVQATAVQWDSGNFSKPPGTPYDYAVIDNYGRLIYQSADNIPTTVHDSIRSHDAALDVTVDDLPRGKVLISTNYNRLLSEQRKEMIFTAALMLTVLIVLAVFYILYLDRSILRPFQKLKDFSRHIALGNLDVPLPMDRNHAFGAFTESFDIMREQLAEAKQKEAAANLSKKELVASLSHDIKTPVTSIKLVSELLLATVKEDPTSEKLRIIYQKAEQIDQLISNMLHATLEDLGELQINLSEESSSILELMIHNADYFGRVTMAPAPGCILMMDPLRMEQVLGNIISNSYKYADTPIEITNELIDGYLRMEIRDFGPGVSEEDLPKLFSKFFRGSNSQTRKSTGSGLGLYISRYLMEKMQGSIQYYNRQDGFSVELLIRLAQ